MSLSERAAGWQSVWVSAWFGEARNAADPIDIYSINLRRIRMDGLLRKSTLSPHE